MNKLKDNEKVTDPLLTEIVLRCGNLYKLNESIWTRDCPYCVDQNNQFQVNTNKNVFHCFACHMGGGLMHVRRDFPIK